MTTTLKDVCELLRGLDVEFFTHCDEESLVVPVASSRGVLHAHLSVQEDGEFLLLSSHDCLPSVGSRTRRFRTMQALLALNHELRSVKFAVDPSDGDVVATVEVWLMDAPLTSALLDRLLGSFVCGVFEARDRVLGTLLQPTSLGEPDPDPAEAGDVSATSAAAPSPRRSRRKPR